MFGAPTLEPLNMCRPVGLSHTLEWKHYPWFLSSSPASGTQSMFNKHLLNDWVNKLQSIIVTSLVLSFIINTVSRKKQVLINCYDFVIISHQWNMSKSNGCYFWAVALKKQRCFPMLSSFIGWTQKIMRPWVAGPKDKGVYLKSPSRGELAVKQFPNWTFIWARNKILLFKLLTFQGFLL